MAKLSSFYLLNSTDNKATQQTMKLLFFTLVLIVLVNVALCVSRKTAQMVRGERSDKALQTLNKYYVESLIRSGVQEEENFFEDHLDIPGIARALNLDLSEYEFALE
jgi:ABC-type multidrug transport system fused ATPase/permease subunit